MAKNFVIISRPTRTCNLAHKQKVDMYPHGQLMNNFKKGYSKTKQF